MEERASYRDRTVRLRGERWLLQTLSLGEVIATDGHWERRNCCKLCGGEVIAADCQW
jgi:hypothetical protein